MLSIDVMDVSGEQQNDISKSVFKQRFDRTGLMIREMPHGTDHRNVFDHHSIEEKSKELVSTDCGRCYGATAPASGCCNTCDEVREAYAKMGWAVQNFKDIEQARSSGRNLPNMDSASKKDGLKNWISTRGSRASCMDHSLSTRWLVCGTNQ